MSFMLRYAICNEVYEKRPIEKTCHAVRTAGYSGIEIAPFTLAENPAAITADQRRHYSSVIQSEGLAFVGLHWLLVSPKGLHVTTPDKTLRDRSWAFLRDLVDLCGDLGPNGVMIFGSPEQRKTTGGLTPAEAAKNLKEGLAWLAPHALERGVTVLLEALPTPQCNVVTSLEEAAAIVREIDAPSIRTMFDTHNAINEKEPHPVLVDRYFDLIRHVHVNELDGKHPGTGNYDFAGVFRVLERRNYRGWVSAEVFDFSAGADRIAAEALHHLKLEAAKIA